MLHIDVFLFLLPKCGAVCSEFVDGFVCARTASSDLGWQTSENAAQVKAFAGNRCKLATV